MKMTKAIREYIEEQVEIRIDGMAAEQMELLKAEADAAAEAWHEALEAIRAETDAKLAALAAEHNYTYIDRYSKKAMMPYVYDFHCTATNYLPAVKAYEEFKQKVTAKRTAAIKDIIVSMELGGTKAELLEMIAKLSF